MVGLGRSSGRTGFVLLAVALGVAARAGAQVGCGDTVTGDRYLTANLACDATARPAVVLASGARLDLRGFTLSCVAGREAGVRIAGNGAVLSNGGVQGCETGVDVLGDANKVKDVIVHFAPQTAAGFRVRGNDNVLKRSAMTGAVWRDFSIEGARNRVGRCFAAGGGEATYGIDGDGNAVRDSVSDFANFNAFLLGERATNTRLVGNVAVGGVVGFSVYGSGNDLRRNIAEGQVGDGFAISWDATGNALEDNVARTFGTGFEIDGPGTIVHANRSFANTGEGITVWGHGCVLRDNLATGNGALDLLDHVACDNTWEGNRFGSRNLICIR